MTSILSNDGGDTDVGFGDLLDRAAAHDRAAIDDIVAEFEPALLQFATNRGATDAESVVNGALSDALTSLPKFRGRDRRAFRAYLYQILRRRIADQYRRAYNQPKIASGLDDDLVSELVDHDASVFDERLADRDLVEEILDQLTEEQREVLEMRVLTGLSIKETATRTGRTEGAVKSMQRRALTSLRSVVIAIAVIVLGVLGIRAVMSAGADVTVVDNSPAGTGTSEGGQSQRPVLEAEVPVSEDEQSENPNSDKTDSDNTDGGNTDTAAAAEQTDTIGEAAEADGVAQADSSVPTDGRNPSTDNTVPPALQVGSAATSLDVSPVGPIAEFEPVPDAPCSVITDGTPATGEVAFVTYHFTGPYELFKGTSVDIIGPSSTSALIPGKASPDKVWNGRRFPFVIGGNMFPDDTFTVKTFLANREVKATCTIDDDEVASVPCTVTLDGEPERGDTASVVYRTPGPYWVLHDKATYVAGRNGTSAMKSGGDARFRAKVERNFVINGSMFRDGSLEVRTMFGDGAGHALCEIS